MLKTNLTFCTLALIFSLFSQLSFATDVPQSVINEMATRQTRYYHYLWHQVREGWNKFPETTKAAFRDIGWEPPRPARAYDENGALSGIFDNDSGEDFLYMHRTMIEMANNIITKNREPYGKIKGWTSIPLPGDPEYPVPSAYDVPNDPAMATSVTERKTDNFFISRIARYEKMYKDPVQLRSMTLGELGARIDVTIHGWIHMRWSNACPVGYRTTFKGTIPFIDRMWDNVTYDWLGDSYASHVHPMFWKIHGWVDDRIEDWRIANNLTTIKWKGTWTGGPMSNLSTVMKMKGMDMTGHSGSNMDVLEKAFSILQESGVEESSFADDVKCDIEPPEEPEEAVKPTKMCKVRKAAL